MQEPESADAAALAATGAAAAAEVLPLAHIAPRLVELAQGGST